MEVSQIQRVCIVLKYLSNGGTIEMNQHKVGIEQTGQKLEFISQDNPSYLANMDINTLFRRVQRLPNQELALMVASNTLHRINEKRRK